MRYFAKIVKSFLLAFPAKAVSQMFDRILNTFLICIYVNPLSANFTKWSNTLEQFVGKLPANCLSVFVYFVGLAPKGLNLNEARYNQEGSLAIWVFQDKVFCKIYYEKEITLY